MKLKNRTVDDWGTVVFDDDGLLNLLMSGGELSESLVSFNTPAANRYNDLCREFDHPEDGVSIYQPINMSPDQWDLGHQSLWFTPEPYASMDVLPWLLERCSSNQEINRVNEEWRLFSERDMVDLLRCLIYIVDTLRERGVIWGVGRGSSVASFALYLIGIHRIDSIKFGLDITEFLK